MDTLSKTLRKGSRGEDVRALQEYLRDSGYPNIKVDGIYGPLTESAVKGFQSANGLSPDGIFGPKSMQSAYSQLQNSSAQTNESTSMYTADGKLNPNFQPRNEQEDDLYYNSAIANNKAFEGNSSEAMRAAAESGDFSGLYDVYGKPFSDDIQQDAVNDAKKALDPRFDVDKEYTTQNVEDTLRQNQANYERAIEGQADQFESDKGTLDQTAADRGVLFSGARDQKERKLQDIYRRNQESLSQSNLENIGSAVKGYQYQYGDDASKQGRLSQYYKQGRNTFDPKVASGGAQRSSLSDAYKPKKTGFAGSAVTAHGANVQSRASGLLRNRSNKLFSTGYTNQF